MAIATLSVDPDYLALLVADMAADPAMLALPINSDGVAAAVAAYDVLADPGYWVYRTAIPLEELYGTPSASGATFSIPAYIPRSVAERDAWDRIVTYGGQYRPALPNMRAGVHDIFSGTGALPVAQRAFIAEVSRRLATRAEKLLALHVATGTGAAQGTGALGSATSPDTMRHEGELPGDLVLAALVAI